MTTLHPNTFDYLQPTLQQVKKMNDARMAANIYARDLEAIVPDGPDKTYLLRKLREVAMWVNIAITRHPDGAPRAETITSVEYPKNHPAPGDLGSVPL
jgi:hypothetical protein